MPNSNNESVIAERILNEVQNLKNDLTPSDYYEVVSLLKVKMQQEIESTFALIMSEQEEQDENANAEMICGG